MQRCYLERKESQFCKMKRVPEVGCTTMNVLKTNELKPPPLKNGSDGKL